MFGLFKKKKQKEYRYEKQMMNIGITRVNHIFSDGRELIVNVYGQYHSSSQYYTSAGLVKSIDIAKGMLNPDPWLRANANLDAVNCFVNDPKFPTINIFGKLKSREILDTEDYFEEFLVKVEVSE